jgi:hypothetical protein
MELKQDCSTSLTLSMNQWFMPYPRPFEVVGLAGIIITPAVYLLYFPLDHNTLLGDLWIV